MRLGHAACLAFLALAAAGAPAHAQGPQALLELSGAPAVTTTPGGAVSVAVSWTYTPPNVATASVTTVEVTWTAACGALGSGTASSSRQGEPGTTRVEGSTTVGFQLDGAVAETQHLCELSGHAANAVPGGDADFGPGQLTVVLPVAFNLTLAVEDARKAAGPQKEVQYLVTAANHGNSRIVVEFELREAKEKGLWEALAPERVHLDPGTSLTIPVIVSTTYQNGYVSDRQEYVLRATPVSPIDEALHGDTVELGLQATAQGFYIPGPSPMLVAVGLAGLALLARPSRR